MLTASMALFPALIASVWAGIAPPEAPADLLKKCEAKYAAASTYSDTGQLTEVLAMPTGPVSSSKPFATAFERNGRFLWYFRHSAAPGNKPDQIYTVSSADQKSFDSAWTLTKDANQHATIYEAMAGPTGISSGSAMTIVPLLRPDMNWGMRLTDADGAVVEGEEAVDGQPCTKISSGDKAAISGRVTLWIDPEFAIRRVRIARVIDPASVGGKGPKFEVITTMAIKPQFDDDIPDEAFAVPKK